MRPKVKKLLWIAPLAIIGMVVFTFVGGEVVKSLWNWLLPPLFGWQQINFWQALGLLVLSRILFGGCGFRGSGRGRNRERWGGMSPEERERFRARMRERCGFGPPASESP